MTNTLNQSREYVVPGDKPTATQYAVDHFVKCAQEAIEKRGRFTCALSGGHTPKAIFETLAMPEFRRAIDWDKVYVFWSDERAVGPDDEMSNYKMAMDAGLKGLVNKNNVFRLKGEGNLPQHADEYEAIIDEELKEDPFDVIMLGMGGDGHTASLFPNTPGLRINDRKVIVNQGPTKDSRRLSMTFSYINTARNIVLYVMGKEKAETVKRVFTDPSADFPVQHVGTPSNKALWILDEEAASLL
ncbi:MAG: 6-phosphogluconolactonase [Chlamydiia bacterium]|nr:6-phosphogluconolactonase [Chlamydiia bacterium]